MKYLIFLCIYFFSSIQLYGDVKKTPFVQKEEVQTAEKAQTTKTPYSQKPSLHHIFPNKDFLELYPGFLTIKKEYKMTLGEDPGELIESSKEYKNFLFSLPHLQGSSCLEGYEYFLDELTEEQKELSDEAKEELYKQQRTKFISNVKNFRSVYTQKLNFFNEKFKLDFLSFLNRSHLYFSNLALKIKRKENLSHEILELKSFLDNKDEPNSIYYTYKKPQRIIWLKKLTLTFKFYIFLQIFTFKQCNKSL